MRTVLAVSPDRLDLAWPDVEPLVRAALDHGDRGYAPVDIYDAVRRRLAVLWLGCADGALEMVAVTEIVQRPRERVARVMALGGRNVAAWLRDGMPTLDAWARAEGCAGWEMTGRRGWSRALRDWTVSSIVMRRTLA